MLDHVNYYRLLCFQKKNLGIWTHCNPVRLPVMSFCQCIQWQCAVLNGPATNQERDVFCTPYIPRHVPSSLCRNKRSLDLLHTSSTMRVQDAYRTSLQQLQTDRAQLKECRRHHDQIRHCLSLSVEVDAVTSSWSSNGCPEKCHGKTSLCLGIFRFCTCKKVRKYRFVDWCLRVTKRRLAA